MVNFCFKVETDTRILIFVYICKVYQTGYIYTCVFVLPDHKYPYMCSQYISSNPKLYFRVLECFIFLLLNYVEELRMIFLIKISLHSIKACCKTEYLPVLYVIFSFILLEFYWFVLIILLFQLMDVMIFDFSKSMSGLSTFQCGFFISCKKILCNKKYF